MTVIAEKLFCDACGSRFDDRIKLAEHAWLHATKKYRCNGCQSTFFTALARVRHDCGAKCDICSAEFDTVRSVNFHKTVVHLNYKKRLDVRTTMFECANCNKKFVRKDSWMKHCVKVCVIQ